MNTLNSLDNVLYLIFCCKSDFEIKFCSQKKIKHNKKTNRTENVFIGFSVILTDQIRGCVIRPTIVAFLIQQTYATLVAKVGLPTLQF